MAETLPPVDGALVDQATERVVNKGGRPPGKRDSYKRTIGKGKKPVNQPLPAPEEEVDDEPYEPSPQEIEFVAQLTEDLFRLVENICVNQVGNSVFTATQDEQISQAYADKVRLQPKSVQMVRNAAGTCAVKYAFLTQFAPELVLLSTGISYGIVVKKVFAEVREIQKMSDNVNNRRKDEVEIKSRAVSPQANQDTNHRA